MNKKLKRYIEEEEKTVAKIAELQTYLKEIRTARKAEEDQEIVRSVRTMKLSPRDLFELLNGIQKGNVSVQSVSETEEPDSEEEPPTDEQNEKTIIGTENAPESEENHVE